MTDEEQDLLGDLSSGHESDGDHSDSIIRERPSNLLIKQCGPVGFLLAGFAVSLSSFFAMISMPLSMAASEKFEDSKDLIPLLSFLSSFILFLILLLRGVLTRNIRRCLMPPFGFKQTMKLSFLFSISGILVLLSHEDYNVLCHLQDPIKGLVLVFALTYYFIFCKRPMSVSQMFSVTVVIVGIFISADFGLCDRFRCRGLLHIDPRERTGNATHWFWTIAYISGLSLWTLFYIFLEENLCVSDENVSPLSNNQQSQFTATTGPIPERVSTVSRLVSSLDPSTNSDHLASNNSLNPISIISLAFWINFTAFLLDTSIMGFYLLLSKQKTDHSILNSLSCLIFWNSSLTCHEWTRYGLVFLLSHLAFVLTSLDFLRRSQSAVMVITMTAPALPLAGLWWSLFTLDPFNPQGLLHWTPELSGELICSLLGLPVVLIGVFLVLRGHLRSCQISPISINQN